MALVYGDFEPLLIDEKSYAYARTYFNDLVITVFNNSDKDRTITIGLPQRFKNLEFNANFGSEIITVNDKLLEVNLQSNSFDIISIK